MYITFRHQNGGNQMIGNAGYHLEAQYQSYCFYPIRYNNYFFFF